MKLKSMLLVLASSMLWTCCTLLAKPSFAPPAGIKIGGGNFFEVYVLKQEEKAASGDYLERIYQVTIVARTTTHGTQRFGQRIETLDADLLNANNWEIIDLDGDGRDDLRYLKQTTKGNCKVWPALRWEKDRECFTQGGPQLARFVSSTGKSVKSCVLM